MSKRRQPAKSHQSHDEEHGVDRSIISLSEQDIDYIARVVATEVSEGMSRYDPAEYRRMVNAVVDTITNRLATGRYGKTITAVVNQRRAFSKINGPRKMDPYGSVQNTPRAPATTRQAVNEHLADRNRDERSSIGGYLDYANPKYSDAVNLRTWINPMIAAGAIKLGVGNHVHYHGLRPGNQPAPSYVLRTPKGFMAPVEPDMDHSDALPVPKSRDEALARMAGESLFSQGFLDLAGRIGGRRPIESVPRYGGPDVRPMPAAMPPMQRSTQKGDRLPRPAAQPDAARWLTSGPAAPEDELLAIRQNFARRLAYENAMQPRPVATQPIQPGPVAPLPFPAETLRVSPVLPPPPVGSGYDRLLPGMLRVTPPGSAPGGLMRGGGLLGGSTGGLGVFIRDDAVAPKSNGKPVKKSGKGKRPVLPPGLY